MVFFVWTFSLVGEGSEGCHGSLDCLSFSIMCLQLSTQTVAVQIMDFRWEHSPLVGTYGPLVGARGTWMSTGSLMEA